MRAAMDARVGRLLITNYMFMRQAAVLVLIGSSQFGAASIATNRPITLTQSS